MKPLFYNLDLFNSYAEKNTKYAYFSLPLEWPNPLRGSSTFAPEFRAYF